MKRRTLGQHLLINENVLDKMINLAEINDCIVFEFGSGTGNLTEKLCEKAKKVISFEIDSALYKITRARLHRFKNLKLIHGDALRSKYKFNKLVSNVPYSRSREFIEWLCKKDFDRAIIMVQDDFAEKLLAKTGSKQYRAISVLSRARFVIEKKMIVGRNAFKPRPRVNSAVLSLEPRLGLKFSDTIIKSCKILFSFRSRKVERAISIICEKKHIERNKIFEGVDFITRQKRIEQLTEDESLRIARELI